MPDFDSVVVGSNPARAANAVLSYRIKDVARVLFDKLCLKLGRQKAEVKWY